MVFSEFTVGSLRQGATGPDSIHILVISLCFHTPRTLQIKAVQLEYSDAHSKLMQAIRKAPQSGETALGFN